MENLRAVPGADQQGLAMAQALGPVAMPPPYAPQQAPGQPQQQGATLHLRSLSRRPSSAVLPGGHRGGDHAPPADAAAGARA